MRNYRTSRIYGENIINPFYSFDSNVSWNVTSGTGNALHDDNSVFAGRRSLKIANTNVATAITCNYTATDTKTIINEGGTFFISFYVRNDIDEQLTGSLRVYKNAVLDKTITFTAEIADEDIWIENFDTIALLKSDEITFDFTLDSNSGSAYGTNTIHIGGFGMYLDDRNFGFPPVYSKPPKASDITPVHVSGTHTAEAGEYVVGDASGGSFSVNLPTIASSYGAIIDVSKDDSSANTITVDANGTETIAGQLTQVLNAQYDNITLFNDGVEWKIK